MNKIYKVIWSKVRNCYVVVSEIAKNHTRSKSIVGNRFKTVFSVGVMLTVLGMSHSVLAASTVGASSAAFGTEAVAGGYRFVKVVDGKAANGGAVYFEDNTSASTLADGNYYVNASGKILKDQNDVSLRVVLDYATAVGNKAEALGAESFAGGYGASASGDASSSLGNASSAIGDYSVAVGAGAVSKIYSSVAIGHNAQAGPLDNSTDITHFTDAIAVGNNTVASANKSMALGSEASSTAANGLAIGTKAFVTGSSSMAIGQGASSKGNYGNAIGYQAVSEGNWSNAIGVQANAKGGYSFAAGYGALAAGTNAISIGNAAQSNSNNSFSIGANSKSSDLYAAALGYKAEASGNSSNAIGNAALASGVEANAIGYKASASGRDSIAIGSSAVSSANYSVSLGSGSLVSGQKSIALGYSNKVYGESSGAIGDPNVVYGAGSYAVGNDNTIGQNGSSTLGKNTFVLGSNVKTTANNSVALGYGSTLTEDNVISIGSSSNTRRILNVADGTFGSEAATVGQTIELVAGDNISVTESGTNSIGQKQFKISAVGVLGYDDDTQSAITFSGTDGTVLGNVKAGVLSAESKEAVNGSQLYAEQEARISAINAVQGNVEAEKSAREAAINDVTDTLNTKVGTLTAKDTELEGKIGDFNTSLTTEVGKLSAKDTELEGKITAESTTRSEADIALGNRIDAVSGTVTDLSDSVVKYDNGTEKGKITLAGAEGTVIGNVKAGELSAESKEAVNGSQLYAEQEARISAINAVQGNVEAEKSAREAAINDVTDTLNTKVGTLTAKDTELEGKIGDLNTSLTTEVGKLSAKDTELGGKITAESTTRSEADIALGNRIDVVSGTVTDLSDSVVKYDNSTLKGKITLAGAEGTVIGNVKVGELSTESKEAVNGSQLYAEQEARKSAGTVLQGNIDAEKTARENAVTEVTNALNAKVGALTAKDTEFEGKIGDLNTSLTTEVGKLSNKDTELEGKISAESTTRSEADIALGNRIDAVSGIVTDLSDSVVKYDNGTEKGKITLAGAEGTVIGNVKAGILSAESKEAVNGSQLYAEQEARISAITAVQGNVDAEKSAREAAINEVTDTLNTKVGTLTAKDTELEGKIGDLNTSLTTEVGKLSAKDTELEGKISAESTTRSEADIALGNRIDAVSGTVTDLSDSVVKYDNGTEKGKVTLAGAEGTVISNVKAGELSTESKEAVNGSQLYAEQEARKSADVVLQGNIDAEKTARESAVTEVTNALNTKVGVLTAKDTELEGKIGDLDTSLTTEVGKLSAKNTELGGKITAESIARSEADIALGNRIDAVSGTVTDLSDSVVKYDNGTVKGKIMLAGAEGTVIGNVKAGELSAESKEAVNGSQLYVEQEARISAINAVQGNVEAEKSAREAAINDVTDTLNTKVGTLTAKDTELEGKIGDLNTSLTTEVGKLSAKNTELEGKITAEKGTRESEVSRLDERIDNINTNIGNIGNAVFYDSADKSKITLAGAEGTVIGNVKAGELSAESKEAVNGSQLYAEQEARKSADTVLQGNIDAEKTARENAVTEVTNALNTKVGVLTAKDTELEGKIGDLNTSLTTEVGKLSAKNTELEGKITAEKGTRESEVSRLDERIDNINTSIGNIDNAVFYDGTDKSKITLAGAEGTVIGNVKAGELSAESKEAVNGSQLYVEQQARKSADIALQGNIDAEKIARENAVTEVTNALNTKVGALTAKDTELEGKIGDLNTSLTTEVGKLSAKDIELEGKITAEKGTRESEVSRLDERIDNINTSIGNIGNAAFYDDADKSKITLAGAEGTVIGNVKAGELSAESKEAVNGSQLYAEQEARKIAVDAVEESLRTNVESLQQKDAEIQKSIADETRDRINAVNGLRDELTNFVDASFENAVTYTDTTKTKISLGRPGVGVVVTNLKDGEVSRGSTDAVTGNQLYEEQQNRKNDIDSINSRIDNIEAVTGGNGIIYDDNDKSSATLGGNDGTVIKNLADGTVAEGSKEAINGGQLYDEIQARIDADNALRQEFGNYVAGITEDSVSYDKDSDKAKVTFKGTDGTTLGNVAGGTIAEGSKEAVNGGQLYETNTKLEGLTNRVGNVKDGTFVKEKNTIGENINSLDEAVSANSSAIDEMSSRVSSGFSLLNDKVNNTGAHAAALAALHPVADDDSKVGFAAGIGSYHNSRAAAIGMFYRPSDRYQFSLGGTTGNGEHMYNVGFAVGLDKVGGGPFANKKAMVREIVSLREERDIQNEQIGDLVEENRMQSEALAYQDKKIADLERSRIEQDEKIDKLMKLVESLQK